MIWKVIEGYEGCYEVSDEGRIRSVRRCVRCGRNNGKIYRDGVERKPRLKMGYLRLNLTKENKIKNFSVHRLVAKAFLPNPSNLPEVNHKDGNKANNFIG
jgi:NUMOD4 motif